MPQASTIAAPRPLRQPTKGLGEAAGYGGWSPKLGRQIKFATRLEFLHWLLLEGTPEVAEFCEYYPEVHLESRDFVFDMWVHWRDGSQECREVMADGGYPEPQAALPEWSVIESWSREHGYRCEVVTERKLAPAMKRINNWRRLLPFVRYARDNPDPALEAALLACLDGYVDVPLRELMRLQPGRDTGITAAAAKLLHEGVICADLDHRAFGPNLLLRRCA